jgi:hypothetical protein
LASPQEQEFFDHILVDTAKVGE